MTRASSFTREQLLASARGELFPNSTARLPSDPMLMFDRIVEINDNGGSHGKGFVRAAGSGGPSNGLRNMATRMEEIGGQFQVNSMPGLGTSVCLHLPLRRRENNPRRSGPRPIQLRDSHKVPRA